MPTEFFLNPQTLNIEVHIKDLVPISCARKTLPSEDTKKISCPSQYKVDEKRDTITTALTFSANSVTLLQHATSPLTEAYSEQEASERPTLDYQPSRALFSARTSLMATNYTDYNRMMPPSPFLTVRVNDGSRQSSPISESQSRSLLPTATSDSEDSTDSMQVMASP